MICIGCPSLVHLDERHAHKAMSPTPRAPFEDLDDMSSRAMGCMAWFVGLWTLIWLVVVLALGRVNFNGRPINRAAQPGEFALIAAGSLGIGLACCGSGWWLNRRRTPLDADDGGESGTVDDE